MIFSSLAMYVNTVDINPQNCLGSGSRIAMVTTQPKTRHERFFPICYSIYHNTLNVNRYTEFLFISRHGPLVRPRNSRE